MGCKGMKAGSEGDDGMSDNRELGPTGASSERGRGRGSVKAEREGRGKEKKKGKAGQARGGAEKQAKKAQEEVVSCCLNQSICDMWDTSGH